MAPRITYKVHDIVIPQSNDPTKTISKTVYESETHHAESGMIGFSAPDATLVSNVLTPADSLVVVRGEGASADTIDHISFTSDPQINDKDLVWLQQGAEAITINHNTSSPPANTGPILLLSQVPKKMIGTRMILLQRQGSNFQEIAYDGIVGNGGFLAEDDEGNAIIVCGSVPSAVNHIKFTNSATTNDIVIEAIGTDSDIGLEIKGKGTKFVTILSLIGTGTKRIEYDIVSASFSATYDLDLTGNDQETISLTGNITFTTSNRSSGRSKTIRILTDGTLRTLTFPAWDFVGTKPTDQAATKTGILTLTAYGTADTDIVAAYDVEA